MANLYSSIDKLNNFLQKKKLPEEQRQFILTVLNGHQARSSLNDIIKFLKRNELKELEVSIKKNIAQTPYFSFNQPYFNFAYIRLLKKVLSNIQEVDYGEKRFKAMKPIKFKKFREKMDSIYYETAAKFQGQLMLPVCQGVDARLANSRGECFGYIAEWSTQIFEKKKFYNVPVDAAPPFKFIPTQSPIWKKYKDLNHLAPLSQDISTFQKLQKNPQLLIAKLSSRSTGLKRISYDFNLIPKFYSSTGEIAEKLLEKTHLDSSKIYGLGCMGYFGGHALGFCKINGKYHFMDSNSGWFRFATEQDFKNWLPFYFKRIGYDRMFAEYDISEYALTAEPQKVSVKLTPLLYPLVLLILVYYFIVRAFIYAVINFKNFLKNDPSPAAVEKFPTVPVSKEPLPESLEALDLAVKPSVSIKEEKTLSSVARIADLLNISTEELIGVKKRVEEKKALKKIKKQPTDKIGEKPLENVSNDIPASPSMR